MGRLFWMPCSWSGFSRSCWQRCRLGYSTTAAFLWLRAERLKHISGSLPSINVLMSQVIPQLPSEVAEKMDEVSLKKPALCRLCVYFAVFG